MKENNLCEVFFLGLGEILLFSKIATKNIIIKLCDTSSR